MVTRAVMVVTSPRNAVRLTKIAMKIKAVRISMVCSLGLGMVGMLLVYGLSVVVSSSAGGEAVYVFNGVAP